MCSVRETCGVCGTYETSERREVRAVRVSEIEWLSIGEAAKLLGIGRTKMREIADAGGLAVGIWQFEIRSRRMPGSSYRQVVADDIYAVVEATMPDEDSMD